MGKQAITITKQKYVSQQLKQTAIKTSLERWV
jgi:hypothetical protein